MSQSLKIFFFMAIFTACFLIFQIQINAQSYEEIQKNIQETSSDIEKLEKEIESYKSQLKKVASEKTSLANSIKELDLTLKKLSTNIVLTERKIKKTELTIQELSSDINTAADDIYSIKNSLREMILLIRETDDLSLIESLVRNESLGEIWRDVDRIQDLNKNLRESIKKISETKIVLEDNKQETEKTRLELVALKTSLVQQKEVIRRAKIEKDKLLAQTKNQESNYNKLIADKLERKKAFEDELAKYESELNFILNPSSFARPKTGLIGWPVDDVRITQYFGKTVAAARLYVSGTHSGVDFGVPIGTPVKSVSSGTILGSGNTDTVCPGASYGNWVLIKHDNGLSTIYGHLLMISKQSGRVERGEVIAYSGNSGYSTGPHLHLTLAVSQAVAIKSFPSKACGISALYTVPVVAKTGYLDPMLYLPAYTR
jgi:murein DD-endopeptidase MepM/ murein hydrolase activator NlpD